MPAALAPTEPAAPTDPDGATTTAVGPGRALVAGAAVLALVSTVVGLTARPLWTDEAISVGAVGQLAETVRGTGGTMALYYVLLDAWTSLFGTGPAAVRSLSVLAATTVVVVAAPVVRRVVDGPTATIALFVLALLPGLARAGQEARSYALATLLVAACWLATLRLVAAVDAGRRSAGPTAALAVLAVLGVTAHGMVTLQLAALGLGLLVHPARRRLVAALLPAAGAAAAATAGLLALGAGGVADWVRPLSLQQVSDAGAVVLSPSPGPMAVLAALAALGTGATVVAARQVDGSERWHRLVPVVWGVVPAVLLVALSVTRPYLVGRYLLPSLPGLALLVTSGVRTLAGLVARRLDAGPARLAGAAVVALLAVALLQGRASVADVDIERWPEAAAVVVEGARPGDTIVFTASTGAIEFSTRTPFEVGWAEVADDGIAVPRPLDDADPLGAVRRFYPALPADEAATRLAGADRIWVVHKTRHDAGDAPYRTVLDRPGIAGRFAEVEQRGFDGPIWIVLLERTR